MNFVVGIFFLGLTVTMIVGKGILMSQDFMKTEWERQKPKKQAEDDAK